MIARVLTVVVAVWFFAMTYQHVMAPERVGSHGELAVWKIIAFVGLLFFGLLLAVPFNHEGTGGGRGESS